ncbi:MAG: hypothetical protein O9341_16755 [Paucibacter sp.]|nr:hypothetical protein [Roseateles sp.]
MKLTTQSGRKAVTAGREADDEAGGRKKQKAAQAAVRLDGVCSRASRLSGMNPLCTKPVTPPPKCAGMKKADAGRARIGFC